MSDTACPNCGQTMQGGDCPRCRAATAFAKPEDAEQARVRPPAAASDAIREWEPPKPWPYKHKPGPNNYWGCFWGMLPLIILGVLAVFALPGFILQVRNQLGDAAKRSATTNNMKQIGEAFHGYHDFHKRLPTPQIVDAKGREVELSWRVAILPFMQQHALHNSFDLTADPNHPQNLPLQDHMPNTYRCPARRETNPTRETFYQCFTGPASPFPDNTPRTPKDLLHGMSNTPLFADAAQCLPWSWSGDMIIHPDQPLPLPADRFYVTLGDASVRMIVRERTGDKILRQLINPNDKMPDAGWDN